MSLEKYKQKRDFSKTPEPASGVRLDQDSEIFVIHKHAASHLHYDLRLSNGKTLKSWAIPHGIPTKKAQKNFARSVEDHPLDYQFFEGNIPEGEYGGGSVMIYDNGKYQTKNLRSGLSKGHLKFSLQGQKLKGTFNLIRLKDNDWIITSDQNLKFSDDPLDDRSSTSGKLMAEIFLNKSIDISEIKRQPIRKVDDSRPMLCQTTEEPFDNPDWIFEAKLDGYRAIAKVNLGHVEIKSRNNQNLDNKFKAIHRELKKLKCDGVLDGEIVMLDQKGVPNFSLLQNADPEDERLFYYVFDLLYFEGHDLRKLPLEKRKSLLAEIIPDNFRIRYVPHVYRDGKKFFDLLNAQGFEGVIAKKMLSSYETGKRSSDCQKIKKIPEIDAVIVGYSKPKGSRDYFGSLVLAEESPDGNLSYIGSVGTGFDQNKLRYIYEKISLLPRGKEFFKDKNITWTQPRYYARVKYLEKTSTGQLRHPSFIGLDEDRYYRPLDLKTDEKTEIVLDGQKVSISHPDKIFFPELGLRKIDLINYYIKVADRILPFLIDRPQNLHRYPDGIHGEHFYHKDTNFNDAPLGYVDIFSDSDQKTRKYCVIKDLAGLIYLVNLGCIELNPWLSKIDSIDNPDILVFDLDPGDQTDFKDVIKTALEIKDFFDQLKVKIFIKTSGMTGMHIFVPLDGSANYESVRLFAELCANLIAKDKEFISIDRLPSSRQNKVYLDYLQNRFGQTIASAYSVRPNINAGVSALLDWQDVKSNKIPQVSLESLIPKSKDWAIFFDSSYSINDLMLRIRKLND